MAGVRRLVPVAGPAVGCNGAVDRIHRSRQQERECPWSGNPRHRWPALAGKNSTMSNGNRLPGAKMVVRAGGYTAQTVVFAPPEAAMLSLGVAGAAPIPKARLEVTYNGFTDE